MPNPRKPSRPPGLFHVSFTKVNVGVVGNKQTWGSNVNKLAKTAYQQKLSKFA
jgi:hypothetical protein